MIIIMMSDLFIIITWEISVSRLVAFFIILGLIYFLICGRIWILGV